MVNDIENELRQFLPTDLQNYASTLAQIIHDAAIHTISPTDAEARLGLLQDVLDALKGKRIDMPNGTIDFGRDNDQRGMTVTISGDVASGNIFRNTIILQTVDSKPSPQLSRFNILFFSITFVPISYHGTALILEIQNWELRDVQIEELYLLCESGETLFPRRPSGLIALPVSIKPESTKEFWFPLTVGRQGTVHPPRITGIELRDGLRRTYAFPEQNYQDSLFWKRFYEVADEVISDWPL